MKLKLLFAFFILISGMAAEGKFWSQIFDKAEYYKVMATGKTDDVNNELELVKASSATEKEAYEGALLMRKAGLVAIPAEKLKHFKSGRIKLETAISKDNENVEYRFLRLIIQEHAPKITKYSSDIEQDSKMIKSSYKNLLPVLQQAITDYSKKSKILHPEDF